MSQKTGIRTPIVAVLGHVDHGKTSLLDRIRGSSVVSTEDGAITQHIGATIVPIDAIRKMSGTMEKMTVKVPGLLFIDTPGHHAFTTLRARGGALADMAILVVDISQGFQPQTIEALQILRTYRYSLCCSSDQDRPDSRMEAGTGRTISVFFFPTE